MTGSVSDAQLHAFFDGQLDEADERAVLAYLSDHPEALRRFREHNARCHDLTEGIADLADDHVDPATAALAERLAERLHQRERRQRLKRWLGVSSAAVVLLATGWAGHTTWVRARTADLPPLLADAARDHVIFSSAGKPVEIPGSEEDLMLRIFASHLGAEVQIPNLSDHGYRLIGGRLLGSAEGPFVQLLYDDGANHPLTLYVAKQRIDREGLQLTEIEGRGAGYWNRQALAYALVADAPLTQVETIAAQLADVR
jgi:anti-sigma factor RsiW